MGGHCHASAALCAGSRLIVPNTEGWVGLIACLDESGKSHYHQGWNPGLSSP